MNETAYKFYKKLFVEGESSWSVLPKQVERSEIFAGLLDSVILEKSKRGRGYILSVAKNDEFKVFFRKHFPEDSVMKSKGGNIRKYRNSKARRIAGPPVFLFRGFGSVRINDQIIDLATFTHNFGVFAATPDKVRCNKLCFVENLEPFLHAERLLDESFLFVHKYGRIGQSSAEIFEANVVTVFVDYDFNGLEEFLRIRDVLPHATLYMPSNYEELYERYAVSLRGNKASMSRDLRLSEDELVNYIASQVAANNRFLEQEILINV